MTNLRLKLLERVLTTSAAEYADKGRIFTNLDTKAQNTATIAGIFLTGAFVFIGKESLDWFISRGGPIVITLLSITIVLLVVSIVFCIIAMKIQRTLTPMASKDFACMVEEILQIEPADFTDERIENFLKDQIRVWTAVLSDISKANDNKAASVLGGQLFLSFAIFFEAIMLLYTLLRL